MKTKEYWMSLIEDALEKMDTNLEIDSILTNRIYKWGIKKWDIYSVEDDAVVYDLVHEYLLTDCRND